MEHSSINFFGQVEELLNKIVGRVTESMQGTLTTEISHILVASLTLYLTFYAYMVWAGKVQDPIREIVWNICRFAIIISIIQNYQGILSLIQQAVLDMPKLAFDDKANLYQWLDDQLAIFMPTVANLSDKASWGAGWLVTVLLYGGFFVATMPPLVFLFSHKSSSMFF